MITCVSCDPLAFPSASSSSSSSSSHLLILLPPPFLSLLLHVFRCKSIYRHFVGDVYGAPFAKILSSTPRFDKAACNVVLSQLEEILDCSANCEYRNTWYTWNWNTSKLCLARPRRRYRILRIKGRFGWEVWHFWFVLENELVRIAVSLNFGIDSSTLIGREKEGEGFCKKI